MNVFFGVGWMVLNQDFKYIASQLGHSGFNPWSVPLISLDLIKFHGLIKRGAKVAASKSPCRLFIFGGPHLCDSLSSLSAL